MTISYRFLLLNSHYYCLLVSIEIVKNLKCVIFIFYFFYLGDSFLLFDEWFECHIKLFRRGLCYISVYRSVVFFMTSAKQTSEDFCITVAYDRHVF